LSYLPGGKFIFVCFPKSPTAHIFRMMTDTMPLEAYVGVAHVVFQLLQVKR